MTDFSDEQQRLDVSVPVASTRDTQFQGFAQLLYADLAKNVLLSPHKGLSEIEAFKEEQHRIIAQRAYDFALHVMEHLENLEPRRIIWTDDEKRGFLEEMLKEDVPDMTKWEAL